MDVFVTLAQAKLDLKGSSEVATTDVEFSSHMTVRNKIDRSD